jgi:hypothetical protein
MPSEIQQVVPSRGPKKTSKTALQFDAFLTFCKTTAYLTRPELRSHSTGVRTHLTRCPTKWAWQAAY